MAAFNLHKMHAYLSIGYNTKFTRQIFQFIKYPGKQIARAYSEPYQTATTAAHENDPQAKHKRKL